MNITTKHALDGVFPRENTDAPSMGANISFLSRANDLNYDDKERTRNRRSNSMPADSFNRLAPSISQRPPKHNKGITVKGRTIYSAVKNRISEHLKMHANAIGPSNRVQTSIKSKTTREHVRNFRDLISQWTLTDLHSLIGEFESALSLWQLQLEADKSRPSVNTLRVDLVNLYRRQQCTDVVFLCDNREFPAHAAIVAQRCSLLRNLLEHAPTAGQVAVVFPSNASLSADKFDIFMMHLYGAKIDDTYKWLQRFRTVFGVNNTFEHDLQSLMEKSDSKGNVRLLFTTDNSVDPEMQCSSSALNDTSGRSYSMRVEAAILAARSGLLNRLLQKRHQTDRQSTIVVDENVIPRIYAPVILHVLYTDRVDLAKVLRGCLVSANSLTEVQAIASGKCQIAPIDQATDIYHIAKFLEFDSLAHGCEDVIVSHLSADCLSSVYCWASDACGSAFVRRNCINLLCRDFSAIAQSPILFDLDESLIVHALKSDFLQASELEILKAVIRWGEHQLIRRMEEREPNILNGTAHSITRKGVKRSDLSDVELKQIIDRMLSLIRIDFILPPFHQSVNQAISRGLLSRSIGDLTNFDDNIAKRVDESNPDGHWLGSDVIVYSIGTKSCHKSHRLGPRFLPFFLDEARIQLAKKLHDNPEQAVKLKSRLPSELPVGTSNFPDALYMVKNEVNRVENATYYESDLLINNVESGLLPPYKVIEIASNKVTHILRTCDIVKKALLCGCSKHREAVLKQVRLRILREENLSDELAKVLANPDRYYGRCRSQGEFEMRQRRFGSQPHLQVDQFVWPDLMTECDARRAPPDLVENATNSRQFFTFPE